MSGGMHPHPEGAEGEDADDDVLQDVAPPMLGQLIDAFKDAMDDAVAPDMDH